MDDGTLTPGDLVEYAIWLAFTAPKNVYQRRPLPKRTKPTQNRIKIF